MNMYRARESSKLAKKYGRDPLVELIEASSEEHARATAVELGLGEDAEAELLWTPVKGHVLALSLLSAGQLVSLVLAASPWMFLFATSTIPPPLQLGLIALITLQQIALFVVFSRVKRVV